MLRFPIIAFSAKSPFGDARLFLVTLTLFPLLRIAALVIAEALQAAATPKPHLLAFAILAFPALLDQTAWPWQELVDAGGLLAGCISGVLSGKGAATILWPSSVGSRDCRTAEWIGFGISLGCAATMAATLGLSPLIWRWGGPVLPFAFGLAATLAVIGALRLRPSPAAPSGGSGERGARC
ncbi:MAG: hypothetical protein KDC27_05750 [Acidobacteria bacterium]|nr:hypothetical protein [Acidobacteriota bacterium]